MITEMLLTKSNRSPSFVVNNAGLSVNLTIPTYPSDVSDYCFFNFAGNSKFTKGDQIKILSCGYIMPLNFSLYNGEVVSNGLVPGMNIIGVKSDKTTLVFFPEFGAASALGGIHIPFENYENYTNIFVDTTIINTAFYLWPRGLLLGNSTSTPIEVSMLNVPASLNTLTFAVQMFAKIEHTTALTA